MKRICKRLALLLGLALLAACAQAQIEVGTRRYYASFFDVFDTVTTIVGNAQSEAEFQAQAEQIHEELLFYHRLFDIYNTYEGINNLKTINDSAGRAAVSVDSAIIDLLLHCKRACELTGGKINVAMGGVLSLWHEARRAAIAQSENARLPDMQLLQHAAQHMDMERVWVDAQQRMVFLSDAEMKLDVGAIAKGWAVERIAHDLPEGILLSVGGNVRAVGGRDADGTPWSIGIENPDGGDYLCTIAARDLSVVTSGDYQRYFELNGERYAHIIDPDTLYPPRYWRSVTVLCADSALADVLSTALFLLPQTQGEELLAQTGASALWVNEAGECIYSSGFVQLIQTWRG